jgi:lysophospholipase L1-like esterase
MKRLIPVVILVAIVLSLGITVSTSLKGDKPVSAVSTRAIKIGFVGDSITAGTNGSSPNAVQLEAQTLGGGYSAVNQGVSGSKTSDWLPGTKNFTDVVATFRAQNVQIVSLMLGTNDAMNEALNGTPTSQEYGKNLSAIIHGLFAQSAVRYVIINNPPYISDQNAAAIGGEQYTQVTDNLKQYATVIEGLVDGKNILQGDEVAYNYFASHPEELKDGIHPTDTGYEVLGQLWATAFQTDIPKSALKLL